MIKKIFFGGINIMCSGSVNFDSVALLQVIRIIR